MPLIPLKNNLRLSSKLLLGNVLTSLALILITVVIITAFSAVRNMSANVADTDIENVISNSRTTRTLSNVFSDMLLLDRTFYHNPNFLKTEGKRLLGEIASVQSVTTDPKLKESLLHLSNQFGLLVSHGELIENLLDSRRLIDQELHVELTKLEELISDWLITSTLKGEETDFVMQQLTLVNGYRESLLYIAQLYAELDLNMSLGSFSTGITRIIEAIDDLVLRLQTITASTQEVARHGELLRGNALDYKTNIKRIHEGVEQLNSLRAELAVSKARTLSAMELIDDEVTLAAQSAAGEIEEIVTWAGTIVVLTALSIITLIFFRTRHLIRFNIQTPMQTILKGIESFSSSDLQSRIILEREDEWSVIGQSLNNMAADLEQSREALQRSYDSLERKVEERTRELAQTVKALSKSESRLLEAQRIAHLGYWSWEMQTGSNTWSEEQYRIFGLDPFEEEVNYDLFASFLHPDDERRVLTAVSEAIKERTPYKEDYRIVRRDGSIRWLEAQGNVRLDDDGEPVGMSGTVLDITERKHIEHLLLKEKERALVTLHSIGDAVIVTDASGTVEYLNPVAEKLTGYELEDAQGQALDQVFRIINEETRKKAQDPVTRCLSEGKVVGLANHTILVSRSGEEYAIQDSAAPIRESTGEILGVVLVFSDVTEARRISRQISYEACHDGLTGLTNRKEFERRLERVVETVRTESTENALCYLDLDQFKLVNDTCGHVAGDEVLRQVGSLLKNQVRHRDTVARLGGDEFGLLIEHCSFEEAKQVSGKLVKAISDYEFFWEDKRFKIGVSIGLVAVNETNTDLNGLLSAADRACFMAKEQGRNRIHVFQENDEMLVQRHGEMQWAVRLPRALKEDSFRLYFQPMVPVVNNDVEGVHYEVLVRLEDDQVVLPNAFISAADRYQLSGQLDRWVISHTFQWLADHPGHLQELFLCAINISGHSLNEESFLEFVNESLNDSPIPPEKICFEITETVAIANFSRASQFMHDLKNKGFRFALDDFGSGLSSFAYLKNLPVDFLKIDGVFVRDILENSFNQALVKAINDIGHVIGIKTIAEYVENEAILEKLRHVGVDYAQGFEIARPKPIEELLY